MSSRVLKQRLTSPVGPGLQRPPIIPVNRILLHKFLEAACSQIPKPFLKWVLRKVSKQSGLNPIEDIRQRQSLPGSVKKCFLCCFLIIYQYKIVICFCEEWTSQVALVVKNPPANAGDVRDAGSIPGLGRSPGGGHGNQCSILAWRIP